MSSGERKKSAKMWQQGARERKREKKRERATESGRNKAKR